MIVILLMVPSMWILGGCNSRNNPPCLDDLRMIVANMRARLGGANASFSINQSSIFGGEAYQRFIVSGNNALHWESGSWATNPGDGFRDYFHYGNGMLYHHAPGTIGQHGWTGGENISHRFLVSEPSDREHFNMLGAVTMGHRLANDVWQKTMLFVHSGENPHWFNVRGEWWYFNMRHIRELPETAMIAGHTVGLRYRARNNRLHTVEYTFDPGNTGWAPPHVRLTFDFSPQQITLPSQPQPREALDVATNIRIQDDSIVWDAVPVYRTNQWGDTNRDDGAIVLIYRDGIYVNQFNAFDDGFDFDWAVIHGGAERGRTYEFIIVRVDWTGGHSMSVRAAHFTATIPQAG